MNSYVPFGMHIVEENELELSEEELAEIAVDNAVAQSPTQIVLFETVQLEGLSPKKVVVDGQEALLFRTVVIEREVARFINIEPSSPTELASGHDWLSRVSDTGEKTYVSRLSTEEGRTTRRSDFDAPMVNPADRFVGNIWGMGNIVEFYPKSQVCNVCHLIKALNGTCDC